MTSNCMPHKECCHTGENITDTDFGYTLFISSHCTTNVSAIG